MHERNHSALDYLLQSPSVMEYSAPPFIDRER
jgi:hypothetical protein